MRTYIFGFGILAAMFLFANLLMLGCDWLTIGYGLNPFIAFPLATVCVCIAFGLMPSFLDEIQGQ